MSSVYEVGMYSKAKYWVMYASMMAKNKHASFLGSNL